MTVTIYHSNKFHHAREQYYAEAGGYTLLRMTVGRWGGEFVGAIKTAVANDFCAAPAHGDREALIEAIKFGVQKIGGGPEHISDDRYSRGRKFAEVLVSGPRKEILEDLGDLAEEMELYLMG